MPSFCRNCGSPLGAAFCPKCGAPAGNTPNPAATPPVAQSYAPPITSAPRGSSALKIVLIVVCCLAVAGTAVVGGVIYLAHRVKQAVVEKAAENGVDLNSFANSHNTDSKRMLPKVCGLLSKEEVSQIIGEPVDRAEIKDSMCLYYGPTGLSADLAQKQAAATFKRVQAPNSNVNGSDVATAVDQMVNSVAAQAGQTGNSGELPLLMIGIDSDGKAQMAAVSATKAIFGGIGQGEGTTGLTFGTDIPNLGDKAIRISKLGLNVLQGETMIRIIPGPFPDADAKTIIVARAVLPKL